jgi:hypothetical protein
LYNPSKIIQNGSVIYPRFFSHQIRPSLGEAPNGCVRFALPAPYATVEPTKSKKMELI